MIVKCRNCQTKFNIDEALVKKEGTKVRCSRCEKMFLVFPPEPIETEAASTGTPIQAEADAEKDSINDSRELDLDFDDSFEEDIMEDFEDLEAEYQKDPQGFSKQADVEASSEAIEEKPAGELPKDETSGSPVSDKRKRSKFRTLLILLVIILGLIGIAFAIKKYAPDLIPDSILPEKKSADIPKTADLGASRLEILTVDGSFVDSEKAGHLFVISGKVRNSYPKSRSFILIKGCILDDKGKMVMEKTAFGGNIFKEEELKSLPMAEVASAMQNRHGIDNQNVNVNPGATMDFMVVFDNLPGNMSEFTVGAVSSSPGDRKTETQD